eukprot:jgi/Undpi1/4279/HiC_scaffold_17.g07645.m1
MTIWARAFNVLWLLAPSLSKAASRYKEVNIALEVLPGSPNKAVSRYKAVSLYKAVNIALETFVGDGPILTVDFDAENMTQPLGLLPGVAADSRMLAGFSSELLEKATTENLTANAHTKGVAPKDFAASGLDQIFRLLAVNADRQGREYVSAVEAFEYPIYGLQWHPEKAPYEWGIDPDGTPDHVINHSKDAVLLAQMLTWFFASETRRNSHSVPSISEWEPNMFHNREVTPTGPETSQKYFLYSKNDGRKRPLASQHAPAGEGAFEPVMLG